MNSGRREGRSQKNGSKRPCLNFFVLMGIAVFFISCIGLRMFVIAPEKEAYTYPLTSEVLGNPLMGLAPWASVDEVQQPHTLVYADVTWREFEPQEGIFDFETFEAENQLERWQTEGKRVVFRFVMDKPRTERHMDIPDWLFEKIGGAGTFYDGQYGLGFSPDYANQVLIEYHQRVIRVLGEKYGMTDFFAYVELGSLGHWGEWHVDPDAGIIPLPDEEIRDEYVRQYAQAFPTAHLLLRRPFNIAAELNLGLFNDTTAKVDSTMRWLDWIQNGGDYSQTGEENALASMPDGWKIAPIGGEQATSVSDAEAYGVQLEQTKNLLKLSHTTFIGPGGPYDVPVGSELQDGIDQVLSTIGYRLTIAESRLQTQVTYCNWVQVELTFENHGIAPMYFNWPTYVFVFDQDGEVLTRQQVEIDLRKILPDEPVQAQMTIPIGDDLKNGEYSLGVAIVDPQTDQPAVQFAMINQRDDLIFHLGQFQIERGVAAKVISQISLFCGAE